MISRMTSSASVPRDISKWASKAAREMTVPKLAELFTGNREKPVYVSKNDEKRITQYWPMKLHGTNKPVLNV